MQGLVCGLTAENSSNRPGFLLCTCSKKGLCIIQRHFFHCHWRCYSSTNHTQTASSPWEGSRRQQETAPYCFFALSRFIKFIIHPLQQDFHKKHDPVPSEIFQKDACAPFSPKWSKETSQASQQGVHHAVLQQANLCVRVLLPYPHHDLEKSPPDSTKALGTATFFFKKKSMLAGEATLFFCLKKWVPPMQCSKIQSSLQEGSVLPTNSPSRTLLAWQSTPQVFPFHWSLGIK